MNKFKDHFSSNAGAYRKFRPDYPAEIYAYLSDLCLNHELAWDCATGNGQSASGLTPFFQQVVATDASEQQVQQEKPVRKIHYRVARAEKSGLQDNSVDLVCVAQALHWFDIPAFGSELQRVVKKGGLIAVWCYKLLSVTPQIDALIGEFYRQTLKGYWPPERRLLEQGYAGIELPFNELKADSFVMSQYWSLEQLIGYLGTWSALKHYLDVNRDDPLQLLADRLYEFWGSAGEMQRVSWPLSLRLWRA